MYQGKRWSPLTLPLVQVGFQITTNLAVQPYRAVSEVLLFWVSIVADGFPFPK